ncbi:MAG: tRNA lysidine(34) synthetase TilS, partial [Bacteroidales bacterium]|nr:tRNA lysidine(34) synthetase TilS [Bacteroidales bacterium]
MNFFRRFEQFLQKECQIKPTDQILIAVSGGVDSMCLLHLLHQTQSQIAVVHCNFQLRGNESDDDEKFVEEYCKKLSIPFYSKRFETIQYANLKGITLQEAARDLRYSYFENLRQIIHFQYIATAHHADDSIETFFINLIRGTGIKGITGIKPRNNRIIRPLLFAYRYEIEKYCFEHHIAYRTDSSNSTDKYLRNQIRHHILPALEKLNSSFRKTMSQNIVNFQQAEQIYQFYINRVSKELIEEWPGKLMAIRIDAIKQQPSPALMLYELLRPYGFNSDTCTDIFLSLENEPGKEFFSKTHRLIRDREFLIIEEKEDLTVSTYYIDAETTETEKPIKLIFRRFIASQYTIPKHPHVAALDADKIQFPLLLRRWQKGDYFVPLGMKYYKKLSDFFVDNKLSRIQKERTWILANGEDIVWIIGYR